MISKAEQWPRGPYEVTLSTGRTVLMQPVKLEKLLYLGLIPDALSTYVAELLTGKVTALSQTDPIQFAKKALEFNMAICKAAVVSPTVVDGTPTGPDEIGYFDLEDEEINTIVSLAQSGVAAIKNFRPEQNKPVATVSDSNDPAPKAKRISRSK